MKTAILVVLLLLLALGVLASMQPARPGQATKASAPASALATPDGALTTINTLSGDFINHVLCNAGSPACGTGADLAALGEQYGIDDAYPLGFFHRESGYGKYGVARVSRSLGNIRCSAGYICVDGFRAYTSWHAAYEDWYKLIRWYIDSLHKTTLRAILYTYAPPGDHNDPDAYAGGVANDVNAWRQEASAGR